MKNTKITLSLLETVEIVGISKFEFLSWPCELVKSFEPRPDRGDPERSKKHLFSGNCGTIFFLVRGTVGDLFSCFLLFFAIFHDFSGFFLNSFSCHFRALALRDDFWARGNFFRRPRAGGPAE